MSASDEISIGEEDTQLSFDDSHEEESGVYENDRGDRYSEESSGYYVREKADPNSRNPRYVKRFNPDTKKKVRVEFFPTSSTPNMIIKNAISGAFQGSGTRFFRVGTKDEDLFFSVILATGELGEDAPTLFYDNPEQYERHFLTELSDKTKELWRNKNDAAIIRFKHEAHLNHSTNGTILVK
jgi:hypothetical protein